MSNVYLKPNIQVDPLFNQWYAWIHLVPPATAAVNALERHLKIMKSYVNSPAMHAAAVRNPAMRGGPFIDLGGTRVSEVKKLIEEMETRSGKLIELARAISQLNRILEEKAKGLALQPLYSEVPDALKGYVELCYDMRSNPSFRLLESLLYESEYYSDACQSIALSEITEDRKRPFMLSTPRLPDDKTVFMNVPFSDARLDDLFRMTRTPRRLEDVSDLLPESFFTENAPPPAPAYDGDGFRIRYFGHGCLLIESRDVRILTDPIISYRYDTSLPRFTYEDLPEEIDYVLITHSHHDHILLETLLQLRHMTKNFIVPRNFDGFLQDPSLQLALQYTGFRNVREVRDLEEISIPGGSIRMLPFVGEHHDLYVQSRTGYRIEIGGRSVLCIADSCNLEPRLYDHLYRMFGKSDLLFLGMECEGAPASWIYGPYFPKPLPREIDRARRARGSNFEEAFALVERFDIKSVYVYAMGQEPWLSHILDNEFTDESIALSECRKLIEHCRARGMAAENLFGKKEILIS